MIIIDKNIGVYFYQKNTQLIKEYLMPNIKFNRSALLAGFILGIKKSFNDACDCAININQKAINQEKISKIDC